MFKGKAKGKRPKEVQALKRWTCVIPSMLKSKS